MTRSRYRFGDDHYPYFMTNTVVAWLPVFSQPDFADVVLDSWRFLQRERDIDILAFVIMWQEGSHPQAIESDDVMWQKIEYIHNNPLRRGYVDDPTHWRYSSARSYAGQAGLIDVCVDWR